MFLMVGGTGSIGDDLTRTADLRLSESVRIIGAGHTHALRGTHTNQTFITQAWISAKTRISFVRAKAVSRYERYSLTTPPCFLTRAPTSLMNVTAFSASFR